MLMLWEIKLAEFPADAVGIQVFPAHAMGIQVKYCHVLHMLLLLRWETLLLHKACS